MNSFGGPKKNKHGKHFSLIGSVTGVAKDVEDDVVKPLTNVTSKVASKVTRFQPNGARKDNNEIFDSIDIARGRKSRRRKSRKSRKSRKTVRRHRHRKAFNPIPTI